MKKKTKKPVNNIGVEKTFFTKVYLFSRIFFAFGILPLRQRKFPNFASAVMSVEQSY
jgi:hypothetical protein